MLRALLFDFDGVIANNEPIHMRMFQKVLSPLGVPLTEEDYYATYLGMDDKGCFSTLLNAHGKNPSATEIDSLIQEKTGFYTDYIKDHLVIFPGVVEFVTSAADKYPLAIASGALRHEIELILDAAKIRKAFQTIVSAEDVSEGKPSPEGFMMARSRLQTITSTPIRAEECLVIEDSIAGLEAARRAGMSCLAVTNTYPRERLQSAARVVDSLTECRLEDLERLFLNEQAAERLP